MSTTVYEEEEETAQQPNAEVTTAGLLADTRSEGDCAKSGSCVWTVRVENAELTNWNGDYKRYIPWRRSDDDCPNFNRHPLGWRNERYFDIKTGYNFRELSLKPPRDTGDRGWCLYRQQPYGHTGESYYQYCAPACDASSCCIPRTGWRIMSGEGTRGNVSSLELSAFLYNNAPPVPPHAPIPPQPPSPPAAPPPFLAVYGPGIFIPSGLFSTICLVVSYLSIARWITRRRQRAILRAIRLEQAKVKEIELKLLALPTRCCDEAVDAERECAVCLEPFEPGDEIRMLPCKHEFHASCVDGWFKRTLDKRIPAAEGDAEQKDAVPTCPLCKAVVVPQDARQDAEVLVVAPTPSTSTSTRHALLEATRPASASTASRDLPPSPPPSSPSTPSPFSRWARGWQQQQQVSPAPPPPGSERMPSAPAPSPRAGGGAGAPSGAAPLHTV